MPAEGSGAERGGGSAPRAVPQARPPAPSPPRLPPEPPAGCAGRGAQRRGRTAAGRGGFALGSSDLLLARHSRPSAPRGSPTAGPPFPRSAAGLPPCPRRRGAPTAREGPRCRGGGGASRGRPAAPRYCHGAARAPRATGSAEPPLPGAGRAALSPAAGTRWPRLLPLVPMLLCWCYRRSSSCKSLKEIRPVELGPLNTVWIPPCL